MFHFVGFVFIFFQNGSFHQFLEEVVLKKRSTPSLAKHVNPLMLLNPSIHPSMGFSRQEYWSGVPLPSLSVISTQVKSSSGWRERLLVLTPKCLHTKAGEQQGMRKWEKMIKPEFSKTLKVMDKVKAKRFITRQDRL